MGYRVVAKSRNSLCEVCGEAASGWVLRGGGSLDRCTSCGHLHRDLTAAPADHRDHAYGGEPTLDRLRLELTYRALVADGVPGRVCEIGFGAGGLLRRFHDAGALVSGIDPDQLGRQIDPLVREHGDLRVGVVEDLAPGSLHADLVIGIHVLEHVRDPIVTLERVRSFLAPGGRAVFYTPAGDSSGLRAYGRAWWMLEDPTHVRFFTADSLARAARRAGFTSVRIDRPLLDTLSIDAASLARLRRPVSPRGALSSSAVLAAGALSAPLAVGARLLAPRWRPTLRLTAMPEPAR